MKTLMQSLGDIRATHLGISSCRHKKLGTSTHAVNPCQVKNYKLSDICGSVMRWVAINSLLLMNRYLPSRGVG